MIILPNQNKIINIKNNDKTIQRIYHGNDLVYQCPIYTPVTAVYASTTKQWVDMEIGKDWWTSEIKFESKAKFSDHSTAIFGQRTEQFDKEFSACIQDNSSKRFAIRSRMDHSTEGLISISDSKIHNWADTIHDFKYDGKTLFYVDNVLASEYKWSDEQAIFKLLYNFNAFRLYQPEDSPSSFNDNGTRTIYYLKIWYEDKLVVDFIPVLDSNGVPCFFDRARQKFYYSSGSEPLQYIE